MSPVDVGPAVGTDRATLLVTYQILVNRWIATRALTWQIPTISLAAQAFLISATTQVADKLVIEIILSGSIPFIGFASVIAQLRIGQGVVLDTSMLDHIEVALLGPNSSFLTHYTATMPKREEVFRAVVTEHQWKGYLWVFNRFGKWPVTRVNARAVWATMQIIVSVAGAPIAILILK